ncbi:MAG: hypothetical protein E7Z90_03595 [Cyanobacteria bacterium SIG29]|nr:hypothetical protein [Cyanobacteria bacterium SIG29]
MNYKCCEYILNCMVLAQSEIIPCCCGPKNRERTVFIENFKGNHFDFEEYNKQRTLYIDMFKKGEIPLYCKGCPCIEEKEWDDLPKIKRIIISNRTKCSCNCIYCSLVTTSTQTKEELNTRVCYDVIPVLNDLCNQNLIDKDCNITIAGGECCEYPKGELEYILYLSSVLGCNLEILSSGIIFSKAIESVLKTEKCVLKISVDSGFKSTYEKIKRVKTYDKVWENLSRYVKATENNKNAKVVIKYIILPGINDNKKEVKKFIEKCNSVSCRNIEIAIEYVWFEKNKNKFPDQKLIDTIKELKTYPFNITFEEQVIQYIEFLQKYSSKI